MHFKRAVHFAAMIHICLGLIFWYFLINLLDIINHEAKDSNMEGLMGIQYFIYLFLFLPLGCLIYRGVKKESVPILQYSSIGFFLLQAYGLGCQVQHGLFITTLSFSIFPRFRTVPSIELGTEAGLTVVYLILNSLYIRQLRSHFYVPPVYPSQVEYFYYPQDTQANVSVFNVQVPCILQNYQTGAYFVQKMVKTKGKGK